MAISQQALDYARKNPNEALSKEILRRAATEPQGQTGLLGGAVGLVKSGIKTALGTAKLAEKTGKSILSGVGSVVDRVAGTNLQERARSSGTGLAEDEEVLKRFAPKSGAETAGSILGDIAFFLAPSSAIVKAEKAAGVAGKGVASLVGRGGIEAGVAGTQVGLQKGGFDEDAKRAALIATLFPAGSQVAGAILGGAKKGIGSALSSTGKGLQMKIIKPYIADVKNGFKVENISKYGLKGNLPQMLEQTEKNLSRTYAELSGKIGGSNKAINLNDVYSKVEKSLLSNKASNFGNNASIKRVLENLKGEVGEAGGENGLVSVLAAQRVKQGAGTKGAWIFGFPDPDAKATEAVYNKFYNILKRDIELAVPEAKTLNKQLSELIPIKSALIRRIPVESRQNAIGLTDSMGLLAAAFDPRALALVGVNRITKNPRFASFLARAGQNLKQTKAPGALRARFSGVPGEKNPELSAGLSIKSVSGKESGLIDSLQETLRNTKKQLDKAGEKSGQGKKLLKYIRELEDKIYRAQTGKPTDVLKKTVQGRRGNGQFDFKK